MANGSVRPRVEGHYEWERRRDGRGGGTAEAGERQRPRGESKDEGLGYAIVDGPRLGGHIARSLAAADIGGKRSRTTKKIGCKKDERHWGCQRRSRLKKQLGVHSRLITQTLVVSSTNE